MRILLCNTYLYRKGGAEVSLFELADLLTRKGHEILFFGMKDPRNEVPDSSGCFVDNIEFGDYRPANVLWNARALGRVLYSAEAASKVRRFIKHNMPDFVYVNNIAHHISPSVLDVFKQSGLRVMMSVRDYKIVCPNSLLLNRYGVCERCGGGKYYNVLIHRCKRNSLVPSTVACFEGYLHRHKGVYNSVSAFLAPSRFCKQKLAQFGVDSRKIFVVPNFVNSRYPGVVPPDSVRFCTYFGRLSKEKGLHQLIEAASICNQKVAIVGDGELKGELVNHARRLGATNVTFRPRMDADELIGIVGSSLFTVFPSLCYETFGRGILESFALGKPVITSRIGALKELVEEGVDGLCFEPGNARDLAEKMSVMFSSEEKVKRMGESGKAKALARFTPENHYQRLMDVWEVVR